MASSAKRNGADSPSLLESAEASHRKKLTAAALRASSPSKSRASKVEKFEDVRRFLLSKVAAGTPVIRKMQEYRTMALDWFFIIWSFLGDKVLYTYSLPWLLWVYDPALGRKFLLLLIYGTTFGNLLKNVFALPRPPTPPLWSHKKLDDFGLPSTHSLNAVTMPWYLLWAIWDRIPEAYHVIAIVFAAFYSLSMFLSRTYLAAHSPADVISGIILGIPILFLWIQFSEDYDLFIRKSIFCPLVTLSVALGVILMHPRASRPSPTHKYSCALMGLSSGGVLGVWALNNWEKSSLVLLLPDWPDVMMWIRENIAEGYQTAVHYFFNVHFGIVLMFVAYFVVKFGTYFLLSVLFDISGISPIFKTLQTSFSKLAVPHAMALDNLDHPQFKKEKENHDSLAGTPKHSAKLIAEFTGSLAVGFVNSYVTPMILYYLSCISEQFLML